ncbi:hypothetical protein CBS147333_10029 [Penicillium roqueforti]|nr:hypothetical protein HAV15_012126 [Penicillium sp. str. \
MRAYKEALTNTANLYASATSMSETNWSTVDKSCVVEVRFTATDYLAQVSSPSSKAEATPTRNSTSNVTSTSTTSSSASSDTGSQTSTLTPTPTSNAALPLATAGEGVVGGAAFAAALFMP